MLMFLHYFAIGFFILGFSLDKFYMGISAGVVFAIGVLELLAYLQWRSKCKKQGITE